MSALERQTLYDALDIDGVGIVSGTWAIEDLWGEFFYYEQTEGWVVPLRRVRQAAVAGGTALPQRIVLNENVSIATAQTETVYTPPAGKIFEVYVLHLQNRSNAFSAVYQVKSGTNLLTGILVMGPHHIDWDSETHRITHSAEGGLPVFVGQAAAEPLIIVTTVAGVPIHGFATIGLRDA